MVLKLLIGLAASVDSTPEHGFAPLSAQHGIPLLAESRWRGFAAALKGGFAEKLVVIGGVETLPRDSLSDAVRQLPEIGTPNEALVTVPRGFATIHGLEQSHQVPARLMSYKVSEGNTGGNVAVIRGILQEAGLTPDQVTLSTNLYHLPRAFMDLHAAGYEAIVPVPAEAFWLATAVDADERAVMRQRLMREFGDSALSHRTVMEINGAADKLLGTYQPLSR